jgi:hypothetical protein
MWDLLDKADQTWIELWRIIQEAFQHWLNTTAPTAGNQGYTPTLPYMQNEFGALANENKDNNYTGTVATQVVALTLQSQSTASTAQNTLQHQNHLYQQMAHQQTLLHANQHPILEQLAALMFNASDVAQGQCCREGRSPATPTFFQPTIPVPGSATAYNTGYAKRGPEHDLGHGNYAGHAPIGFGGGNALPSSGGFAPPGGAFVPEFTPPPPVINIGQG